jgi:hypothetical protein
MEIKEKSLIEGIEVFDVFDPVTSQHYQIQGLGMQDFMRVAGHLGGVIKEIVGNMQAAEEITAERVIMAFIMNLDHFAVKFEENLSAALSICTGIKFSTVRKMRPKIWLQTWRAVLTANAELFSDLSFEVDEIKKKAQALWPGLFKTEETEPTGPEVPEAEPGLTPTSSSNLL